jgi:adenylate cyclase
MAVLKISDAGGRQWEHVLSAQSPCTVGRAPDNTCVLDDSQASRQHAHIVHRDGAFVLVDGVEVGGEIKRSTNHVFVNGEQQTEHRLQDGDRITIGASTLEFAAGPPPVPEPEGGLDYDEDPLGHTQLLVSARDVLQAAVQATPDTATSPTEELATLRRKSDILSLIYEMSTTLSSVFTLEAIFDKAADILLRVTPADRVLVLVTESGEPVAPSGDAPLKVAAMRVRRPELQTKATNATIGRTVTRKVMRERAALLSQDAAADRELAAVQSILSQGIRSTICAPLVTDTTVHGALYADRLDPFTWFTRDDLQLVTAVAAQTAVAIQSARTHERLAREEVARATYGRFLPDYVVKQILEDPGSIKLGGVNQIVTVLFADIRGFTRLSEQASPERVVRLLNLYFTTMSEIILKHGGTVDKFIGDGLMALFGAPQATPDDAAGAISAAIEMQQAMKQIGADAVVASLGPVSIGIGLHTGEATVGYIGSDRRSEYTAIGDTVNVSSRLESHAKAGEILVSEETKTAAGTLPYVFVPREPIRVRNREKPIKIFEVDAA